MKQRDLEDGLKKLGLRQGDAVLLHSSLSSLGQVEGGANAVVDAFLNVVGPSGTLAVPTFGDLGIVTRVVRERPEAVSSIHPRASVAAIGGRADEFCRDHWKAETAHGEDTPYLRLANAGGYVCLLGVDQDRNTSLHTVEVLLRLPYLRRTDEFVFSTPEGEVTKSWPFFPGPHRNFIGLDRILEVCGAMTVGRIGPAVVRLIKSREMIDALLEVGRRDPAFALCDNPHCADCLAQRAALRRARFGREAFSLATAASLAGHYPAEMVENCRSAGLDAVELDCIQGYPVQALEADKLAAAVEELRRGGCEVTALRGQAISADIPRFLQRAASCKIGRVLLPLSAEAGRHQAAAVEAGISISFYNAHLSSEKTYALMSQLKAGLTFNAANFTRCGEQPFSTSYHNKLKQFTDQLDIEDCRFDGTSTPLARGNAEIAELVSILRCSGFSGYLVLGPGNRCVGSLAEAAAGLVELLESI